MISINNTPWEELTGTDILALLDNDNGESFFFEFKTDDTRNQGIHKEISAFANTFGGYIFIGVKDDKTIEGCSQWTEQRIHNVIYNGISPTPDFDVKRFVIDGKTVYVIRIDEGSMPPYITTDGKIFERVSSGSMPVNNSSKLSQLYEKHKDSLLKLENKIGIQQLQPNSVLQNLCGCIDIGFEIRSRDRHLIAEHFADLDFSIISNVLRKRCSTFSISRVGFTRVITIGHFETPEDELEQYIPEAAIHNFMILMPDGSAKLRMCLFADEKHRIEISGLILIMDIFKDIYNQIYSDKLRDNFICARHYEKMTVLKQFYPYYKRTFAETMGIDYKKHAEKYGYAPVLADTRWPFNDYTVIDKGYFQSRNVEYSIDEVIRSLFSHHFALMGFMDIPNKIEMKRKQELGCLEGTETK